MNVALIALGSNLGARRETLLAAFRALSELPNTRCVARSSLHETAPEDCPAGSGSFLNAAVLLHTELEPHTLLAELQRVELEHGRERGAPNGPRTLDLDLVLYGQRQLNNEALQLPHPRAHTRLFVLEPAAEIAPDLRHPVLQRSLRELRDKLRGAQAARTTSSAAS